MRSFAGKRCCIISTLIIPSYTFPHWAVDIIVLTKCLDAAMVRWAGTNFNYLNWTLARQSLGFLSPRFYIISDCRWTYTPLDFSGTQWTDGSCSKSRWKSCLEGHLHKLLLYASCTLFWTKMPLLITNHTLAISVLFTSMCSTWHYLWRPPRIHNWARSHNWART